MAEMIQPPKEEMTAQCLDSREVAEMVEKPHSKLLKDIRRYTDQLNEAKIGFVEFWQESKYVDAKNQVRPRYLITKKGCEFIAHKMTGTKGTVFTARYIERFHEMEDALQAGSASVLASVLEFIQKQTVFNQKQNEMNEQIIRQQEKIIRLLDQQTETETPNLRELEDESKDLYVCAFDQSDAKYRRKLLNRKVKECADLLDLTVMETFHQLYDLVEDTLHIDLTSFMHVYRWQTGEESHSPLYVIAAHDTLFDMAIGALEYTIDKKRGKI